MSECRGAKGHKFGIAIKQWRILRSAGLARANVGFPAGIPRLPLNLPLLKGCQIVGVFWGAYVEREPAENARRNQELLALIAERRPDSFDSLAAASGRAKSNLSRTFRSWRGTAWCGWKRAKAGSSGRVVTFEKVELRLALAA